MWRHNHESIHIEWDYALVEDHNSFEMCRMTVRTDQLLHIAVATGSQIYTRDLEAKAHGQARTLVLSLKQYHTNYFYEKRMTRVMVGLQGLHSRDAFRCSNIKSFSPWHFKLGGNTEMIATHLREVHYWLAIACDLCKLFIHISMQSVLEHCSGCKVNHTKECAEQEGCEAKNSHKKKSKCESRKKLPKVSLSGTDESCRVKRCLTPSIQFC